MSSTFQSNAVYRFFTAPLTGGSNSYLTLTSTGQVMGAPLAADDSNGTQKWRVTKRSDGFFDISNVGIGNLLGIAPPSGSEAEYTLSVIDTAEATAWELIFNSIGNIVFKPSSPAFGNQVIDLSSANRLILWEQNGAQNQTWFSELLSVDLQWVPAAAGGIPPHAVRGGYDSGGDLYVARAHITQITDGPDGYAPGKAAAHFAAEGGCVVRYYYQNRKVTDYEVLVGSPETYVWVPYNYDSNPTLNGTPMTPFEAGNAGPDVLWVSQGKVDDSLICGLARADTGAVYLPYDGANLRAPWTGPECKVLCLP